MVVSRQSFRLNTEKEEEEYTKVLHGGENIINYVLRFLYETDSIDACVDYTRPSIAIDFKLLKKPFLKAKRKGVRLRYVTEITKEKNDEPTKRKLFLCFRSSL